MSYSIDFRRRTLEYYHEGHTQAEVFEAFKVYPVTLRDWEARNKAGNLKPNYPENRKPRKLPPDELKRYISEYLDAFVE
jgi:transposase